MRLTIPGPFAKSFVAAEARYISERPTLCRQALDAATVVKTLTAPIGRAWEISAGVRNLFNERYADPGSAEHRQDSIQQDGRTFRVGVRWIFGPR